MRHYSVLGDIQENSEISLAILCIDNNLQELIRDIQDSEKFIFAYLAKDEIERFKQNVIQDELDLHIGSMILFENINTTICKVIDCKDIAQPDLITIFQFIQSIKPDDKFNVMNPLKKKNTVTNICNWIQENYSQVSIVQATLRSDDAVNTTRYYALDNEERELLIKLLAKADKEDIESGLSSIKERRQALIENYRKEGRLAKAEELLCEIDDLVIHNNEIFASNHYINVDDEFDQYSFLSNYSEKSKQLIKSCLISERALYGKVDNNFDYTLCASGYWRAIEIELNLVLVDGLRYYRHVINKLPSDNVSLIKGPVEEKIGTRLDYKLNTNIDIMENINRKGAKSILKSVMFGSLTGLSQYYSENNVLKIFDKVHELNPDLKVYKKLDTFLDNLNIVYEFRNRCSHQDMLYKDEFIKLKNILFDLDCGIFKMISELKKSIYSYKFTEIREK